jgi:hypothetical protein
VGNGAPGINLQSGVLADHNSDFCRTDRLALTRSLRPVDVSFGSWLCVMRRSKLGKAVAQRNTGLRLVL